MQKKLIAVAVAGALAAPAVALAQTSTVNIYGTITASYIVRIDPGRLKTKHDMFETHDTSLGFRGEEKLGGGLSAWFQCESTADITGEETAAVGGAANGWCSRNSGFGFKGGFGNIFWGNWSVGARNVVGRSKVFGSTGIFGSAEMLWNGSGSNVGNGVRAEEQLLTAEGGDNRRSFYRRQINSWHYHTPNWGGFQAMGTFSAPDEATALLRSDVANKPRMWSLGGSYTNGPLYLQAGYEKHKDYNPGNQDFGRLPGEYSSGTDRMYQFGAAYTFARVFELTAMYTDVRYKVADRRSLDRKTWLINGEWNVAGPHVLRAGYTNAGDAKGSALAGTNIGGMRATLIPGVQGNGNNGADLVGLQYAYKFSKRTEVNFGYARIDNDRFARYAIQSSSPPIVDGQKTDAWSLGINHTF